MEVRKYRPATWFTAEGCFKKKLEIMKKGVPDMTDWRFVTVTVDPAKFDSPQQAYQKLKARTRRFAKAFMEEFGATRYCCKLEFQENGWPHWHYAFDTGFMTVPQLLRVTEIWRHGRTNVRRIEGRTLDYFFKYIYKSPSRALDHDDTLDGLISVPRWFQDWRDPETGATYEKARFWFTSEGFYTLEKRKAKEKPERLGCRPKQLTVRESCHRHFHQVEVSVVTKIGKTVSKVLTTLKPQAVVAAAIFQLLLTDQCEITHRGGVIIDTIDPLTNSLSTKNQKQLQKLCLMDYQTRGGPSSSKTLYYKRSGGQCRHWTS